MASDKIKINTGSLKSDAETIRANIAEMKKLMTDLQNSLTQLDAMWDGPTSEAFKSVFHSDVNALDRVISYLNEINKFEDKAKADYEKCERYVGEIISAIRV